MSEIESTISDAKKKKEENTTIKQAEESVPVPDVADMESNSDFVKALLNGNIKEMNYYMNKVALATFSYFDTGKNPSGTSEPEKFYHGFVLGLIVELSDSYEVKSNRESGFGRYDVMIIPQDKSSVAMVLEFKVHEPDEEKTLEETVASSLAQIEEKKYDAELINRGVDKENIHHYGFAFRNKEVLIDGR